jgi:RNA polymerase sigma-70 factor, ECF subfamily
MSERNVQPASPDFERVFEDHSAFVWRVLARHGVQERDLEDVCQEVFLVVFKGLPQFAGRSSLRTWLYGICRRVAANHRRLAVHRREALVAAPHEAAPEAACGGEGEAFEAFAHKQSLSLLDALLSRLPAEQREVFVLYEIEELTMREVAEALECSPNTAFSRLYAAREALAAALKRLRARRRVA